ncbi:MAG: ATP-dependent Clp protease proteolytic subunit [Pseudomonadota bacterium]
MSQKEKDEGNGGEAKGRGPAGETAEEEAEEKEVKSLIIALTIIFLAVPGWAEEEKAEEFQAVKCPTTTMQRDCLKCHVAGDFRVIETAPEAHRVYPNASMRIVGDEAGYFVLTDIDSKGIKEYFDYLNWHKIKRAVIEIHSPGGGLFDAQRIVGIMRHWQSKGIKIETRIFGAAFSAGFYVFTAGDTRLVDEYSDLMWHEIQTVEGFGFKISTPSDREEAARVLRHLQDIRNAYLVTRGKLSKQEIDEKIAKKEFWMSGADAVKYGFADGFIK